MRLHALRSLCRERYVQSATYGAVALRWLCSVGYVALHEVCWLHKDRYVHIGFVVLFVFGATCSWESVRFFSDLCIHQPRSIGSVKD